MSAGASAQRRRSPGAENSYGIKSRKSSRTTSRNSSRLAVVPCAAAAQRTVSQQSAEPLRMVERVRIEHTQMIYIYMIYIGTNPGSE